PAPAIVCTHPDRILVRGVNWLGDAVLSTPAVLRLREARPQARITLLTRTKLADLWQHHPAVDEVLTLAEDESVWQVARRLRAGDFQLALVLPNSPRSALESWLARIPQRIGYARPWRNALLTQRVNERPAAVAMHKRSAAEINRLIREPSPVASTTLPPTAHHLHHYLHLVAALGANPEPLAPRIEVTDGELAAARERFRLDAGTRWLGVNAGAEYGPAKRWPKENFAAVANQAAAWPGWGVVIVGGKADALLAAEIESAVRTLRPGVRNLAGQTTLRELCAVLKLCQVVLTNDTGPMHVAAAVGTRVVALFGSTSPELTGPGLPGDSRHHVLTANAPCAPCFLRECPIDFRCLRNISVERVVEAVAKAVGAPARPTP
ncbi:MAG: lipopolysaccharide heptosyltransferase II, partial [Limisphaerales bacterium]